MDTSKTMSSPAHAEFLEMIARLPGRRNRMIGALNAFCSRIPGLKFVIERYVDSPRIIFVANHSSPFEFPGAVVKDRRVVSLPPLPPKLISAAEFVADKKNSDGAAAAIDVNDGTTITLYWCGGSWAMSTQRGYDIRPVARGCAVNFETAARECLAKFPAFSFAALDRKICYTIGFKHPEYHPYVPPTSAAEPESAAWFIRAIDLNIFNAGGAAVPIEDIDIGIHRQTSRAAAPEELIALLEAEPWRYGFIVGGAHRPRLVESHLMQSIRHIMYDVQATRDIRRVQLITSYLDPARRDALQKLFPQYAAFYAAIEKTIAAGAADFDTVYASTSEAPLC